MEDFPDLSPSEQRLVEAITFRMNTMKEDLLRKIEAKDEIIAKQGEEITVLKAAISRLEDKMDEEDSYVRRDTLLFSGKSLPVFSPRENTGEILRNLLRTKVDYSLPEESISVAHRLGPAPTRGEDRRTIIAKLCRRELKTDIRAAMKRTKPENLYVNESLTPVRRTIHYVLRKAREQFKEKISGISTYDGNICVYVKPNRSSRNSRDVKFIINTRQKLEQFCRENLATPLSTLYKGNWDK